MSPLRLLRHTRRVLFLFVFLLSLAVSDRAAGATPDRSKPPVPGPPAPLKLPAIQSLSLSNGIRVLFIESRKVPLVQVGVVVRAGAASDPKGKAGLANMTAEMLDRGAGGRSALELSDAVDHLGAELSASAGWDETVVGLNVPSERFGEALAILADVVLRPTFPAEELERVRKELLTELLQWRDEPRAIARVALARALYGEHPYGRVNEGSEPSVRAVTREDLRRFHASFFAPGNVTLVAAGDVAPQALLARLEEAFGSWNRPASRPLPISAASQVRGREVWLIDVPKAAQSEIRIGRVGPPRSTPDYFPLIVANTLLGGSFTSRLNQNLREQHGYTYGASSRFDFRLSTGPFFAAAAVQTDKTAPALTEFFKELEAIRRPVGEEELARARNYVALRYPAGFETTGQLTAKLEEKVVFDLPDDYFTSYMDRVANVTPSEVARVTAQSIDPRTVVVVVVGDRRKIEPGIRALKLGPLKVFSVDEILGPRSPRSKVQGPSRLPPRMDASRKTRARRRPRGKAHNLAWAIFFFIVGVIGVMVPIMPQIPFFVMSLIFLSLVFPSVRRKLRRFLRRHPRVSHAYKKWRDSARRKRQKMIRKEKELAARLHHHHP